MNYEDYLTLRDNLINEGKIEKKNTPMNMSQFESWKEYMDNIRQSGYSLLKRKDFVVNLHRDNKYEKPK